MSQPTGTLEQAHKKELDNELERMRTGPASISCLPLEVCLEIEKDTLAALVEVVGSHCWIESAVVAVLNGQGRQGAVTRIHRGQVDESQTPGSRLQWFTGAKLYSTMDLAPGDLLSVRDTHKVPAPLVSITEDKERVRMLS